MELNTNLTPRLTESLTLEWSPGEFISVSSGSSFTPVSATARPPCHPRPGALASWRSGRRPRGRRRCRVGHAVIIEFSA